MLTGAGTAGVVGTGTDPLADDMCKTGTLLGGEEEEEGGGEKGGAPMG